MRTIKDAQQALRQAHRALARARRRQLDLALRGRFSDSMMYARRARRIQTSADRLAAPPPVAVPAP